MAQRNVPTRHERTTSVFDRPFEMLKHEIDDLFSDFAHSPMLRRLEFPFQGNGFMAPSVDVSETDKKFEVSAELPGVDEKDIDISVTDGVLTISAQKKSEKEEKGKTWHRVERSYGTFQRSLTLPAAANENKVEATFDKGVLTISVLKKAEAKPPTRKITVKSS